jgi:uracil-DNA glycosylase
VTTFVTENIASDEQTLQAKRLRAFEALDLGLTLRPRAEEVVDVGLTVHTEDAQELVDGARASASLRANAGTEIELEPAASTVSARSRLNKASSVLDSHTTVAAKSSSPDLRRVQPSELTQFETLESLQGAVANCKACGLCKGRTQTVFSSGYSAASLAIVGEAPGAEEDRTGQAFVGQAGKLLDSMLSSLGLNRTQDAYICNVLKCRPPNNRDPAPDEVAQCEPYLQNQLHLVQPQIILVVGRFAAQSLLRTDASIASLRGKLHTYPVSGREVPVVVTYHPAYLLRNLGDKAKTWADLCFLQAEMAKLSLNQ